MNDLMTRSFMDSVDLKGKAMKDLESGSDPEMDPARTDENLIAFLEEVEEVKKELKSIKARIQASSNEDEAVHKPEALLSVLKRARAIHAQLEEMDRVNSANKRLSGCYPGSPLDRARTGLASWLREKLKEMMTVEFQAMWQKDTITGNFPHNRQQLLAMQEHDRGKAVETVVEVEHRHDAAAEIERSLSELYQMIMYLTVVVVAQGEKINDIEHHMNSAANNTYHMTKNLGVAYNKQHKKSRKCLLIWITLGCFLFLLPLIIVSIAFWDRLFHHFDKAFSPPPPNLSQPK